MYYEQPKWEEERGAAAVLQRKLHSFGWDLSPSSGLGGQPSCQPAPATARTVRSSQLSMCILGE